VLVGTRSATQISRIEVAGISQRLPAMVAIGIKAISGPEAA
jgi:hypothetical protein